MRADRRTVVFGISALGVSGCAGLPLIGGYDAVVSKTARRGRAFASIAEAVAAAPGRSRFRVLVTAGEWRERVNIAIPNIELIGEGREATKIVFNTSAGDVGPDGRPIGTFGTPTVYARAPGFAVRHLTIANDFDYPAHMPGAVAGDRTGASGAQAVALAIQDEADRTLIEDVALTGWQDTLFVDAGRSLFRGCKIEGCVDFIFGAGRAVFDACEILSLVRPGQEFNGYVAAPATNRYQPYGLLFVNCRLTKASGMAAHSAALGRAWRRTGSFRDGRYGDPDALGAAVFAHCWMDDHIMPEGWAAMSYTRKGGERAQLQPQEARLFEFDSNGPGAGPASVTRRILSPEQALYYTPEAVLDGWTP